MSIFGKLKRKKEPEETVDRKSEIQKTTDSINRFTMMVEDIFTLKNGGVVVVGFVNGKITTGDALYLHHPLIPIATSKVEGIEVGVGKISPTAENQNIGMKLINMRKEDIPVFTVLSNIKPQLTADVKQDTGNPELLGLLPKYIDFCKNVTYLNVLFHRILHTRFLMAMYEDEELDKTQSGAATVKQDTNIEFPILTLQDRTSAVPVFTDGIELSKGTNVLNEQHATKAVGRDFQDVAGISLNNHGGIVINPFGRTPVFMSNEMIDKIMDFNKGEE